MGAHKQRIKHDSKRHSVIKGTHNGIHKDKTYDWRMRTRDIRSQAWDSSENGLKMDTCVIVCCLLAFLLYLNTLPADFAFDDSRAIVKNPDLTPESSIVGLFYNDFWGTPLTHSGSHKSYRPLCVLTFRLNYYIGALNPMGYHLFNVILHAVVTAVFTVTVKILVKRTFTTFIAGLLFAAHPIHTEAVAGIVGRADILSCLFFLCALLCYIKYCKHRDKHKDGVGTGSDVKANGSDVRTGSDIRINSVNYNNNRSKICDSSLGSKLLWLGGTGLCTSAAMLSKEQGVTVLAVCAIYDVFIHSRLTVKQVCYIYQSRFHHVLEGLISLCVMGVGFISFRVCFMGNKPPEFSPSDNPASDNDSLITRTLTYLYLPCVNFWLLLFPKVLSFDWSMDAIPLLENVSDLRNLCTFTFYVLLGYFIIHIAQHMNVETEDTYNKPARIHNGNGYHAHSKNNGTSTVRRRHARRGSNSSTGSSEGSTYDDSPKHDATPSTGIFTNHTNHILVLSLAFLIFPFIPATNLFFYVGFVIAERVLYIPSMGFCLLVAEGATIMRSNPRHTRILYTALALLVTAYSVRTVIRNEDWLNEENLYRSGITVNPAKAWGNLANILNNNGRPLEAEEAYKSALRHRGNMADVHYNLGILLQEQKRYNEAIESYRMAIQCRPRLTMAHLNLAMVLTQVGHKEDAEQIYRHCSEIDISGLKDPRLHEQTKISALYNLGRLLADQERYEEAVETYLVAIKRRPNHFMPQSLYNMLGEAYFRLGDYTEAEKWYSEALKAKPDHIPAHLTMGRLFHKLGRLQEAEDWFIKARMLEPGDGSVYQHYGQFLTETERHTEAADNYVKAASVNPTDFDLVFNTANALRQAGRNLDAEAYYKKAAQLKPDMAQAHMNVGAMLHYNGKLQEAEEAYLTALQLKPDDSVTQANLKKLKNLMEKSKAAAAAGNNGG